MWAEAVSLSRAAFLFVNGDYSSPPSLPSSELPLLETGSIETALPYPPKKSLRWWGLSPGGRGRKLDLMGEVRSLESRNSGSSPS